jgi:hypothetical protein
MSEACNVMCVVMNLEILLFFFLFPCLLNQSIAQLGCYAQQGAAVERQPELEA